MVGNRGTVNIWRTPAVNQLADVLARMLSPAECRQARESVEQLIDWRAAAENRLRMNETFFLALLIMSARHAMASFQHKAVAPAGFRVHLQNGSKAFA
jgi:hypothetical protein